MRNMALSEIIY